MSRHYFTPARPVKNVCYILNEARREKSPPGGVITRVWPRCMERNKIAKAGPKPRLLLSP